MQAAAIAAPLIPFTAHFFKGADTAFDSALFASVGLVLCGLTLAIGGWRNITATMIVIVVALAGWTSFFALDDGYRVRPEMLSLFCGAALFMTGHFIAQHGRHLDLAWRVMNASLIVFVTFALVAHALGHMSEPGDAARLETLRLNATFVSPNSAATAFGIALLLAIGRLSWRIESGPREAVNRLDFVDIVVRRGFFSMLLALLAATALILTASRAGIILSLIAAAGLIVSEYAAWRRLRGDSPRRVRRMLRRTIVVVIILAAVGLSTELLALRAGTLADDARSRLDLFSVYAGIWRDAPLLGHGLGSFNAVNDAATTLDTVAMMEDMGAAHNVVLQWLLQTGVVGTGIVLGIIALIHLPIVRAAFRSGTRSRTYLRATLFISGLVISHGMLDYALEIPSIMWSWGLILGLANGRAVVLLRASQHHAASHPDKVGGPLGKVVQ